MRRAVLPALAVAVAVGGGLLLLTGGGGRQAGPPTSTTGTSVVVDNPRACPPPTPLAGGIPPGFPYAAGIPEGFTVVSAMQITGVTAIELIAPGMTVQEVQDGIRPLLQAAGYPILSEDYEGREAEIYFTADGRAGTVGIGKARCLEDATGVIISLRGS